MAKKKPTKGEVPIPALEKWLENYKKREKERKGKEREEAELEKKRIKLLSQWHGLIEEMIEGLRSDYSWYDIRGEWFFSKERVLNHWCE